MLWTAPPSARKYYGVVAAHTDQVLRREDFPCQLGAAAMAMTVNDMIAALAPR